MTMMRAFSKGSCTGACMRQLFVCVPQSSAIKGRAAPFYHHTLVPSDRGTEAPADNTYCCYLLLLLAGVSGPIAFDKNGDVIPHDRTYMWVKHNVTTGVPIVKGYISRK